MIEGATLREHLTTVWERTGNKPERLANDLPDGCSNLWHDFLALHNSRGSAGMGGPLRISWADLDAYQRVRGFRFEPWEIEAIRRADGAYMTHFAESRKKPEG